MKQLWGLLIEEAEKRHRRLEEAHKAQQYYFDAAEAEAWMSEQELYMMSEEKAKVSDASQLPGKDAAGDVPQKSALLQSSLHSVHSYIRLLPVGAEK